MRARKRVVHHVFVWSEAGMGFLLLLRLLDRHCRSHNIAAECCVWSGSESMDGLESRLSKAGGRMVGKVWSVGSCLMSTGWSKRVSLGDAGLAAASTEPLDSMSEGAGVETLG